MKTIFSIREGMSSQTAEALGEELVEIEYRGEIALKRYIKAKRELEESKKEAKAIGLELLHLCFSEYDSIKEDSK